MKPCFKATLITLALVAAGQAMAQATFYQDDHYQGATFTTDRPVESLRQSGFNDKAASVIVSGKLWEVCDRPRPAPQ